MGTDMTAHDTGEPDGKVSRSGDLFVFRISGAKFTEMPLGRVAAYMVHLTAMAGAGAYFHKMTSTTIQFRGQP